MNTISGGKSDFDGGLFDLIIKSILGGLLLTVTIGIAYPWVYCMMVGWRINHTIIDGRRLHFYGNGGELIGQWIKMILLMIITLGIYSFWVGIALEKWAVERTHFE